jgi:hypothetical protein
MSQVHTLFFDHIYFYLRSCLIQDYYNQSYKAGEEFDNCRLCIQEDLVSLGLHLLLQYLENFFLNCSVKSLIIVQSATLACSKLPH